MTWHVLAWTVVEVSVAYSLRSSHGVATQRRTRDYARALGTGDHALARDLAAELEQAHHARSIALGITRAMFGRA